MAAALVQAVVTSADGFDLSSTPVTLSFGGVVTAGSTVIVLVATNSGSATITVDDLTNGSYTQAIYNDGGGVVGSGSIHYKHNVSAFTNVRVADSVTDSFCKVAIFEVSGLSAQAPTTGSFDQTGATSHDCAATGLTGSGIALAVSAFNTNVTGMTQTASWTLHTNDGQIYFMQHFIGTLSASKATFSTGATSANSSPAMALFEQASGSVSWMPGSAVSQGAKFGFVSTGMTP